MSHVENILDMLTKNPKIGEQVLRLDVVGDMSHHELKELASILEQEKVAIAEAVILLESCYASYILAILEGLKEPAKRRIIQLITVALNQTVGTEIKVE